jgi:hypothetical protein
MRIKKVKQIGTVVPKNAEILNEHSTSTKDVYACDYINNISDYSTEEQVVGRWINGKPLYRKVFDCGSLPNSASSKVITTGMSFSDYTTVKMYGIAIGSGGIIPIPNITPRLEDAIALLINGDGNIGIEVGRNRSSLSAYATIEYTKTTD